jgi:hypothetical protein
MGLMRPFYEAGHYLAANDLATEQQYRVQRLRRHRRYLHGFGVVCGLQVVPAQDPSRPWAVLVCPGYALGPWGDEIHVPVATSLDVRDYLWMQPPAVSIAAQIRLAYVGIRYREEPLTPVRAGAAVCGCDDSTSTASRIRDGFQIHVLWGAPEPSPEPPTPCAAEVTPCPSCPKGAYVMLARLTLPAGESDPIRSQHIDNWSVRPLLSSTAMLQAQLTPCCCDAGSGTDGTP